MTIAYPRKVTITIEEENNVFTNVFITEDSDTWQNLVLKLLNTVNAVYGYDVKESVAFVNGNDYITYWTEAGERTISKDAFSVARSFDKERDQTEDEEWLVGEDE
jgi:hypothetical protein